MAYTKQIEFGEKLNTLKFKRYDHSESLLHVIGIICLVLQHQSQAGASIEGGASRYSVMDSSLPNVQT